MRPRMLLLDEPASSLDPSNCRMLKRNLDKMSQQGMGLVIATHDVDFAWEWADRILVFHDGMLEADGRPEESIWPGRLAGQMRPRETFIIPDWTDLWPASASQNDWRTKKRRRERISRPKQTALWIQGAKEMADDEAADSRIFAKSGQMAGYVISGIFAYAGPGFIGISGHIMDGVVSGNDHSGVRWILRTFFFGSRKGYDPERDKPLPSPHRCWGGPSP